MKAIARSVGVISLLTVLLASACVLPFTGNAEAREITREYAEAQLVKCGDSYYSRYYSGFAGILSSEPTYLEYKGLGFTVFSTKLDAADRANGVEWAGVVGVHCEMARSAHDGQWSEWSTGCYLLPFTYPSELRKQNGVWMIRLGSWSVVSVPAAPDFNCEDVPK